MASKGRHTSKKEQAKIKYMVEKYITLRKTNIKPQIFKRAIQCKVMVKKLEKQHNIEIGTKKWYFLKWTHIGYLSPLCDWTKHPKNVTFLGKNDKYYRIEPSHVLTTFQKFCFSNS